MLASQQGDVGFASTVAKPNDETADCGLEYGIHGVCHQMANRILYATAIDGNEPITAQGAMGYYISVILYGKYGGKGRRGKYIREEWNNTIEAWKRKTNGNA